MSAPRWYVLIHQIPARPLYLRAKIRKRLTALGAVPLKGSVYVLPARERLLPQLSEIAVEAKSGGGDAFVLVADFVDARDQQALVGSFRRERDADYKDLARDLRTWTGEIKSRSAAPVPEGLLRARLARAKRRLTAIAGIDFFESPARRDAEAGLAALETLLLAERSLPQGAGNRALLGRTWVTRRGIQIDRIASAWFVRRFIDPKARIRFIDPGADPLRPDEIRFDMVGGDFTHEGDRCSFETLISRTRIKDRALAQVAEIVHDLDIKDGKFGRPETSGVQQLLLGMLMANAADEARLERGFALLDDLYESFTRRLRSPASSTDPSSDRRSTDARRHKGGRS